MDERRHRKVFVGTVVSDRMQKTVVVAVERFLRHPMYNKRMRRRTKVKAHDEAQRCRLGDRVKIMETRPLSRDKRWRIVEVVRKAE
ncbi:MAG: 30S ribosomal protein S17 [candidate division NC10 bacterium]|jgi:small subunit ribosomal protein S17|uniref:Small ribosomal subunit protein uS17 n=2 Tax=environmental samples TaxID=48479 RepID=A0A0H4TBA3_9BACT|nr:30S ribosomal protein S17, small subunit ribosomal protein S17 [uncultured bacterium Rifle_16ft_4_minimus_752]AKQ05243.1 30S ribosomal protein S17, small subunit ribosomal protein S17 [uncultured bacterium Rifle_16ft_4_minimus_28965]MDZ4339687.1 30S ribosomal protein S17 [candidate division NC10 bacterium]HZX61129.1 30S ribosomal protein S17 [Candidatus Methylomirabilis sp.]